MAPRELDGRSKPPTFRNDKTRQGYARERIPKPAGCSFLGFEATRSHEPGPAPNTIVKAVGSIVGSISP